MDVARRGLIVLIAISFAVMPQSAFACSCAQSTKPQQAERAAAIFTGTTTAVSPPLFGLSCSSADPVMVTFTVETVYKGEVPKELALNTASAGASCGYTFVAGKRYTVFVIGDHETNLCLGNVEGAIAPSEYGLGEGRSPRS